MASFLHIGTIRRAHGLRGQVKVALDDAESEVFAHIAHIWVSADASPGSGKDAAGDLKKWPLREARSLESGLYLVTLEGVGDRSAAEALQLRDVYAARAELPELAEDEVYQADLVGCEVVLPGGAAVGTVSAIEQMNGNFLLVVERPGREAALVPMVPAMITDIDLTARRVEIDPPEGLLDLDLPGGG